jgi:hypothetical protein
VTVTGFEPAGADILIVVAVLALMVAAVPPKVTPFAPPEFAPTRFVPVMFTSVPPPNNPDNGEMLLIVGIAP